MKDYEERKYEVWRDTTEQLLPTLMKKSLLMKVRCHVRVGIAPRRPQRLGGEAGTAQGQETHRDRLHSASVSPLVKMSWIQWHTVFVEP